MGSNPYDVILKVAEDCVHRGHSAAEPQPNLSIHLTQEAQWAQKERKRRSGQSCFRAEAWRGA